ncbi:nucleotide-diphospho-sugar transferase, partial [Aureobasidium melanogenum]
MALNPLSGIHQGLVTEQEFASFGNVVFKALKENSPGDVDIKRTGQAVAVVFWTTNAETPRPDLLNLTATDVATMRFAHNAYLQSAQHISLPFQSGASGIVSAAAGKYLPVFVISLRMLRRTGSQLPVELFVDTEAELASHTCQTLLPSMNAHCLRLEDRLGKWARYLASFQVKVFAILASSFENVLFLDADAFVAKDPSHAFVQEPFSSTGLVTWPDFWASSASTHLFEITGQPVPAMNALASTESGQLLVSKSSHALTLLLAAYYNYYGPDMYYPLMSQGGPGEGDKDSFILAARVAQAPFHQVKKCVDTIGYYEHGAYHGGAMLQYDPTQDSTSATASVATMDNPPDAFSVHHNIPKYDPVQLFDAGVLVDAKTGVPHRLIGTKEETEKRFGRDIEKELWEEIDYVSCELGNQIVGWKTIPTTQDEIGTCDKVRCEKGYNGAPVAPATEDQDLPGFDTGFEIYMRSGDVAEDEPIVALGEDTAHKAIESIREPADDEYEEDEDENGILVIKKRSELKAEADIEESLPVLDPRVADNYTTSLDCIMLRYYMDANVKHTSRDKDIPKNEIVNCIDTSASYAFVLGDQTDSLEKISERLDQEKTIRDGRENWIPFGDVYRHLKTHNVEVRAMSEDTLGKLAKAMDLTIKKILEKLADQVGKSKR